MRDQYDVVGIAERTIDRVRVFLEAGLSVLRGQLGHHDVVAALVERADEALPAPGTVPPAVDQGEGGQGRLGPAGGCAERDLVHLYAAALAAALIR